MNEPGKDRFPRGAIVVVVVGILATLLVAWISDEDLVSSKPLPWLESHPEAIPSAGPAKLGESGSMTLTSSGIDSTGLNSAGYRLFQVGGELTLDFGDESPAGATVTCSVDTEAPTVNARTPGRPAGFPGPVEDLSEAAWPGDVIVDYSEQGSPYSTVTLPTDYMGYGGQPGIEVEWGEWRHGSQSWIWHLPADLEGNRARLRFVSLWRTFEVPGAEIACSTELASGADAELATGGSLPD
jgi:hypothetical protein